MDSRAVNQAGSAISSLYALRANFSLDPCFYSFFFFVLLLSFYNYERTPYAFLTYIELQQTIIFLPSTNKNFLDIESCRFALFFQYFLTLHFYVCASCSRQTCSRRTGPDGRVGSSLGRMLNPPILLLPELVPWVDVRAEESGSTAAGGPVDDDF